MYGSVAPPGDYFIIVITFLKLIKLNIDKMEISRLVSSLVSACIDVVDTDTNFSIPYHSNMCRNLSLRVWAT